MGMMNFGSFVDSTSWGYLGNIPRSVRWNMYLFVCIGWIGLLGLFGFGMLSISYCSFSIYYRYIYITYIHHPYIWSSYPSTNCPQHISIIANPNLNIPKIPLAQYHHITNFSQIPRIGIPKKLRHYPIY